MAGPFRIPSIDKARLAGPDATARDWWDCTLGLDGARLDSNYSWSKRSSPRNTETGDDASYLKGACWPGMGGVNHCSTYTLLFGEIPWFDVPAKYGAVIGREMHFSCICPVTIVRLWVSLSQGFQVQGIGAVH